MGIIHYLYINISSLLRRDYDNKRTLNATPPEYWLMKSGPSFGFRIYTNDLIFVNTQQLRVISKP